MNVSQAPVTPDLRLAPLHDSQNPALYGSLGTPGNFKLEPGHARAAMFSLSGDSLLDWAAAKIPFLQKEIPVLKTHERPVANQGASG